MNTAELKAYLNCDDSFLITLIQKFIEESSAITKTIDEGAAQGNWNTVRANAHKMLSSVRIFDLKELESTLEWLEQNAEEPDDISVLTEAIKKFDQLAGKALEDMRQTLATLTP